MRALPQPGPSVDGQAFVVVGGGSGIGKRIVEVLAGRGAHVLCLDREEEAARCVAEQLGALGRDVSAARADVTDPPSIAAPLETFASRLGAIHGLCNCAGVTGVTGVPSHEVPLEDFDAVLAVNLRGAFVVSQAILPAFERQGYGRLLQMASIAGKEGNPGMVSYSASKAGLIGMVKSQGKEYARSGITINAIAPAVIRTQMVDAMPQEQVDYMTARIPMGRCGTLDEIAELAAWVLSPAASFTTGFTFDLSGGRAVY